MNSVSKDLHEALIASGAKPRQRKQKKYPVNPNKWLRDKMQQLYSDYDVESLSDDDIKSLVLYTTLTRYLPIN